MKKRIYNFKIIFIFQHNLPLRLIHLFQRCSNAIIPSL